MLGRLTALVVRGIKTATRCSQASYQQKSVDDVKPGSYQIIVDGRERPECVIRIHSSGLIRFNNMAASLAAMEGEDDLSLRSCVKSIAPDNRKMPYCLLFPPHSDRRSPQPRP
ncbi:ASCH domain-containing protein [Izhakiella capsodis]|uniref:ASCH domain-containing protein n=1 Tax=Izhakiella capsodis TaxID=1367852 RepID=UPI000B813435|nr:ASCH domain-containing protein [Izhakiella capsodis]